MPALERQGKPGAAPTPLCTTVAHTTPGKAPNTALFRRRAQPQQGASSVACHPLAFYLAGTLNDLLDYAVVLDWTLHAAEEYGRIRAHLTERGTPIGAMGLLIAAHARAENVTLVTDNLREFKRVPRLKVENWIKR
jgi:predicted nucleic acid-binding protein